MGHISTEHRTALKVKGFALFALSFQTLGIIYADLGTSPLYVLNGIWPAAGDVPPAEDVIGGISAIIWALTILPLIKYVFIAPLFGEGGTFALFQGLYPPEHKNLEEDRVLTGDDSKKAEFESTSKMSPRFRWPLLLWALFGTSLTLADGVFTPAVSVTSAVGGIAVAKPSVASSIVPISIGILIVLFLFQFRGTNFISTLFAPVTFLWLALLAGTGIANITAHPGIFRAFDPSRAILLFVRTRNYDLLAGVLLALTGCEAMFANLGQFNMLSIQISFGGFVYPCLVLAYLGQGARLIRDGEAVLPNLFYNTIPGPINGGLYWVMFVLAILATVIASQALISATFSLTQQLINMRSLPPLRLVYTSDKIQGQIYIPFVNWLLLIITVVIVAAFRTLSEMTNAYGFAVATVMFTTTVMIALQIKYVKGWSTLLAVAFLLVFGFFDGLFWGAALKKVPEGAWVPLMIGGVLVIVSGFWTWARSLEDDFDASNRKNLRDIIVRRDSDNGLDVAIQRTGHEGDDAASEIEVSSDANSEKSPKYYMLDHDHDADVAKTEFSEVGFKVMSRIPTCAVFYKLTPGSGVPHSFVSFFRQLPVLPRVIIFLSLRVVPFAHVHPDERYLVNKVRSVEGFYGVTYHLGFRDSFDVNVDAIVQQISEIETNFSARGAAAVVQEIRNAAKSSTHIVPHYVIGSKPAQGGRLAKLRNIIRGFFIEDVYRTVSSMFPETANWLGYTDKIIHVGINASI
ncbi:potassium transporter [Cristinia sonorae]|uniref:Potassium transporter n=1 Tax=Cristinia sonorae TaxID=1940300 RepID=A0A8K0UJH8_9AGAR|nr:potassium transporter [Cristinia sonorae]